MTTQSRIYLASPHMSDEGYEHDYIDRAFAKNFIAPLGENVDLFEKRIAEYVSAPAAVALSSGTAAIHLALLAAGVGKGDVVLCQALTFSASANPILYLGAEPVFIDSEYETWNMSPDALERAFNKYDGTALPKPKAVISVNLYGMASQIERLSALCKAYGVPLIEDSAEALGTTVNGKCAGTFGAVGVYSFNGNKIITTSGGGMLVFNQPLCGRSPEEAAKKVKFWATQSKEPERYYLHKELGFNYRLSNICAGIGVGQMEVLEKRVEKKRRIFEYYRKAFRDLPQIRMMPAMDSPAVRSNCWLSSALLDGTAPDAVIDALAQNNIEARRLWNPMQLQPFFANCDYIDNGKVSETLFRNGICLPSDTKMSEEDLDRVVRVVRGVL